MKGNQHRKLYDPDRFDWRYYRANASRRLTRFDKKQAIKAARHERKASVAEGELT